MYGFFSYQCLFCKFVLQACSASLFLQACSEESQLMINSLKFKVEGMLRKTIVREAGVLIGDCVSLDNEQRVNIPGMDLVHISEFFLFRERWLRRLKRKKKNNLSPFFFFFFKITPPPHPQNTICRVYVTFLAGVFLKGLIYYVQS